MAALSLTGTKLSTVTLGAINSLIPIQEKYKNKCSSSLCMNNIKKIWYKKLTFTFFHKINTVLILTRFTIFLSLLKMLQVLDVHCFCGSLFRVIGILFEDVKYFSFVAHNIVFTMESNEFFENCFHYNTDGFYIPFNSLNIYLFLVF